jgi:hypothetical protein
MSFTASAATALFTILADDSEDDDGGKRWDDQTKSRDLYTQFVISFALGLGAFISFCVGFGLIFAITHVLSLTSISRKDPATKMDGALCRSEATTLRRLGATRAAG